MLGLTYLKNVSTLKLDVNKCTGCQMCAIVCPHDVFTLENKKSAIKNIDACMECGACELNCSAGAVTVNSGVGCAAAVISGRLKGTKPACGCDCGSGDDSGSACCC